MKKKYVNPCACTVETVVVEQLLTASGNLQDMTNGEEDIFGSDDEAKSRNENGFGNLW